MRQRARLAKADVIEAAANVASSRRQQISSETLREHTCTLFNELLHPKVNAGGVGRKFRGGYLEELKETVLRRFA